MKKQARRGYESTVSKRSKMPFFAVGDPALVALFNSSIPRASPGTQDQNKSLSRPAIDDAAAWSDSSKSVGEGTTSSKKGEVNLTLGTAPITEQTRSRKRKRTGQEEEIEEKYLRRLANEEQKSRAAVTTPNIYVQALHGEENSDAQSGGSEEVSEIVDASSTGEGIEPEDYTRPKHESLAQTGTVDELEKAARTVFLGNVSTLAIKSKASKKLLLDHLGSIFVSIKNSEDQKVESIRFRSTAFSNGSLPKKAAFAKRELMDATTQSTNAYAVYNTTAAAREAVKCLNGTIVLDRHLRVDSVAHPSAIDHRRCVFVGNLGFVDDESIIRMNETEDGKARSKAKVAADVEEGLWIHFAKVGPVESVRVVRDRNTRVGKGIAYVQFKDPNSVEKALSFNDKKFPPMLPRKLRVTRARKLKKATTSSKSMNPKSASSSTYKPKQSGQLSSLAGRANRLLGRAAGHQVRKKAKHGDFSFKSPEEVVFEGYRAVPTRGSKPAKEGKKKKRSDRRTDRSSAYRARSDAS